MKLARILISCALILALLPQLLLAQGDKVRPSLKSKVMQRIGTGTDITIDYSRPGVKGREVWGGLVPYGMAEGNQYSDNKPYPWRAGANENTTITFSTDVKINGQKVAAGTYGIHMIPATGDWTIIFSNKSEDWGSYSYDEAEDALRITVTPSEAAHEEWLAYGFEDLAGKMASAYMHWEKIKVSFTIETGS